MVADINRYARPTSSESARMGAFQLAELLRVLTGPGRPEDGHAKAGWTEEALPYAASCARVANRVMQMGSRIMTCANQSSLRIT